MAAESKSRPAPMGKPLTEAQLLKQIAALRRKGCTLADHAFTLDVQPSRPEYAALADLWRKFPS